MKINLIIIMMVFMGQSVWGASSDRKKKLLERAEQFRSAGLISLARHQYEYILKLDPNDSSLKKKLTNIRIEEAQKHYHNSLRAKEVGALKLALLEANRSLEVQAKNKKTQRLVRDLEKEIQIRDGLKKRVTQDYLEGLKKFQSKDYDRALESFIRVLNMHPNHDGALTYIEKIGQRTNKKSVMP